MNAPSRVTAEELIRALKKRRATLPAEIGSFVVLEACEALLASQPALLSISSVEISDEGSVNIGASTPSSDQDAAVALHRLLATMLVAAGPAPHAALMRLVEQGPTGGRWTLAGLRDDLEASLVPLNRNASRRVLSRFIRETGWAERVAPRPSFQDLDSELSSLLGVADPAAQPEAPPEPALSQDLRAFAADLTRPDSVDELDDAPEDQVRFFDSMRPVAREPTGRTVVDPKPRQLSERPSAARRAPSERPSPRLRVTGDIDIDAPKRGASPALLGVSMVLLSAAVLGLILYLRPELLDRLTGKTEVAAEPKAPVRLPPARPQAGDLVVRVATERAQVLRFVGRGPVTIGDLPVGVAHEFVALADGYAPTRLLVARDAEWEATADGKRYEAAMQLAQAQAGADLGDSLIPRDVGSPGSELGAVRIVTSPKGAKVYQLIGFAPEALVQDLPLEATQELMIFKKGHTPELRVVAPSDYQEREGKRRAELDVTLTPIPKTR